MLLKLWVCKPSVSHLYYEAHTKNTNKTGRLIISALHTTWMVCGDWRTHQVGHPELYSTCSHCPSPRSATIALQQCQATTVEEAKLAIKHFCNLVGGNAIQDVARLESLPSQPGPVSLAPAMHHQLEPHNKVCDCVHLVRAVLVS